MAENDPPPPPKPNLGGNPPPPPVVGKPVEEPPLPKTSYTDPPPAPIDEPEEVEIEEEEFVDEKVENKLMLILVHFVGLFGALTVVGNAILPLILWVLKRNDTQGMDREGRAAVNFQLAMSCLILVLAMFGWLPLGESISKIAGFFARLVVIYNVVMSVWAVAMVNIGKPAPYPKFYDFLSKIIGPEEPEEEPSDPA
ncbi:DUF4870 domain-containing protein [Verrucomicrobiales bacterium]|nr:DUF4870 domain-containing protein [Verrucomicrobiales bacterium]